MVRLIKGSFTTQGPFGEHLCLVLEPMRQPLWTVAWQIGAENVPALVFKPFLEQVLVGLDFLHSECHIIHTGKFLLIFLPIGILLALFNRS